MKNLNEIVNIALFIGSEVNLKRLEDISCRRETAADPYTGSTEYTVFCSQLPEQNNDRQFRVTKALSDHWEKEAIHFTVVIYVENDRLIGGQIHKRQIRTYGNGSTASYETEPTTREIGMVRRLLDYISLTVI